MERLFEAGEFRHRLQLLSVAGDRVEQQMVRAGGHQILEPLAHLLGRAVDARGVRAGRIVVDLGEPALELATRHGGSRPAASNACFKIGTAALNAAMLDPPEPIQPSASEAVRRSASGWPTPIHRGGRGLRTGRVASLTFSTWKICPR